MGGPPGGKPAGGSRNGNVFVTGFRNLGAGVDDDYWTTKFKADGSGVAWRAFYNQSGGADQATAIVVDATNNVIVTGYVWNVSNRDIHTVKYDGVSGQILWEQTFNGAASGSDVGTALAVDSLDNIYVGGNSQNADGNDDYVILKYGPNGGTPVWQALWNGADNGIDQLTSLTAGLDGRA